MRHVYMSLGFKRLKIYNSCYKYTNIDVMIRFMLVKIHIHGIDFCLCNYMYTIILIEVFDP